MADDFGVGSINAYGAPESLFKTPHLNRLAGSGMRFTNANTPASICSPTRYALMTGRYAWRGPLPYGVVNVFDPMIVETGRMTLPKFMQNIGYQTAQIGKWHLGYGNRTPAVFTEKLTPGPNDIGFDYHFGLPQNLDDMLRVWIENDMVYGLRSKKVSPYAKSFYGQPYVGARCAATLSRRGHRILDAASRRLVAVAEKGSSFLPLFRPTRDPTIRLFPRNVCVEKATAAPTAISFRTWTCPWGKSSRLLKTWMH